MEQVATRSEIHRFYNFDDVLDGNDAIDIKQEAEALAYKKARS